MTKEEIRQELERQTQRFERIYGGEITTYAAQPAPERKPWRKRASLRDQTYEQEIDKLRKDIDPTPT